MSKRNYNLRNKTISNSNKNKKPKKQLGSKQSVSNVQKRKIDSKQRMSLLALGVTKIRLSLNGSLKSTQITQRGKNILNQNPTLVKDFLSLLTRVKISGFAKKQGVTMEFFDPHDESSFHSGLFKLNIKGQKLVVKEVMNPAFPFNPHSQFVLHQNLQKINEHLKKFDCFVVPYLFAWEGKRTSFLVSPFIEGITLEKWLTQNEKGEFSEVFNHFLKSRRILSTKFGIRDVTTRNVIYNQKTGKLTFFDLMPPN